MGKGLGEVCACKHARVEHDRLQPGSPCGRCPCPVFSLTETPAWGSNGRCSQCGDAWAKGLVEGFCPLCAEKARGGNIDEMRPPVKDCNACGHPAEWHPGGYCGASSRECLCVVPPKWGETAESLWAGDSKPLKDSGERTKFATGAVRDSATGKGRYDLISPIMMDRVAKHLEKGAQKYEPRNWEKGMSISRCFGSLIGHAFQALQGYTDEDHLAAVICNAMFIMHYVEMIRRGALPASLQDVPDFGLVPAGEPDLRKMQADANPWKPPECRGCALNLIDPNAHVGCARAGKTFSETEYNNIAVNLMAKGKPDSLDGKPLCPRCATSHPHDPICPPAWGLKEHDGKARG